MDILKGQIWRCKDPSLFGVRDILIIENEGSFIRVKRVEGGSYKTISPIGFEKNFTYLKHKNDRYSSRHKGHQCDSIPVTP